MISPFCEHLIPFEKPVPPGFYDPSEDKFEKDTTFKKQTRAEIEGVRRDDIENEEPIVNAPDKIICPEHWTFYRSEGNPESIFEQKIEKKRSKLILPSPQISDKEMEEIVKIGQATDTIREFSDNNPTSTLLHDYQMPMHENTGRTARTPSMYADVLQKEAENLLALQNAPTPLKGGINTPLHDLNLQSALPQDRSIATPNTVLSNIAATPSSVLQGTPGQSEPPTPSGTPFRDQLSINNPQLSYDSRGELKKALSSLPAPRNEFVIMAPPEETEASQEETADWVEDASEENNSLLLY
ncbi:hypothetical protein X798_06681 [Onchocerca flexuosa]|uniref:Pre-mRNA splicing factor component Cdc5p/Cef1 C-terminal domain-containing protein n=1 Tax=Onchocerca flexuosa TaxID=387005 RepID=A0A238BLQ2_9BILA|nr:hypothetical protein X798_06681 [Onchocerca flexuosa]